MNVKTDAKPRTNDRTWNPAAHTNGTPWDESSRLSKTASTDLNKDRRITQLAAGLRSDLDHDDPALATTFARTQGLLPEGLVATCLDVFFCKMYPVRPVLHTNAAQKAVVSMEVSTEACGLIVALCAYVMIRANMAPSLNMFSQPELVQRSNTTFIHALLEESVQARNHHNCQEYLIQTTVLASWFCSESYLGLGQEDTAWDYLQEALTQAQSMGMHDEQTYKHDPLDTSRKRVLYWVLFISERQHALRKHRPMSLHATMQPPLFDEEPSDGFIAVGLKPLIALYKAVDNTFIGLLGGVPTDENPAWFIQVNTQLSEVVPTYLECDEVQGIEVRITQQWLKATVWQLYVCQGPVSSVTNVNCMTIKYSIEILRELLSLTHQLSAQVMDVNGVELIMERSVPIRQENL
ncbi:hypothetical protein HBI68_253050 [Parastagonospora nodorum]|nr:hypothetical protein HBI68_253050 [Parastagonospora nodorum]